MVAYHSSNVISAAPFKTRKYKHRLSPYNSIMHLLKNRCPTTDFQILEDEESQNYKSNVKDKWGVGFQLVPPDIHRRNAVEHAIYTFEAYLLAVL